MPDWGSLFLLEIVEDYIVRYELAKRHWVFSW